MNVNFEYYKIFTMLPNTKTLPKRQMHWGTASRM